MNKVLIEIYCPASVKSYDFWVSKKMNVKIVFEKITDEICSYEQNQNLFPDKSKMMLFSERLNRMVNVNYTVEAAGITSGDKLMIV